MSGGHGDVHTAWTPRYVLKFILSTLGVYVTFLLWGVRCFRAQASRVKRCALMGGVAVGGCKCHVFKCSSMCVAESGAHVRLWPQVLQERLTAEGYHDSQDAKGVKHTFPVAVLNLVQSVVAMVVGAVGMLATGYTPEGRLSKFALVGLSTTIASPIGCT